MHTPINGSSGYPPVVLLFEAVAVLPPDEGRIVRAVLDDFIVKRRTKQFVELHG